MFGNKKKKAESLLQNGARAVGTITNVRDTGTTINDNPRVQMTFRIEPLDGSPAFEAGKTSTVSRVAIPQAGCRYPVLFDPADRETFAYLTSDGGAEAQTQIVSMFGDAFGPDGSGVGRPAATPVAAPAPAAAAPDPIERLKTLDELRRSGALSEEEFTAQKQRLLGDV